MWYLPLFMMPGTIQYRQGFGLYGLIAFVIAIVSDTYLITALYIPPGRNASVGLIHVVPFARLVRALISTFVAGVLVVTH
jgi:hypothetical protein